MPNDATWDAALYADHTAHHRAFDDHILGPVTIEDDFAILDLGSGAGDLTAKLATVVPNGSVIGVDSSEPLIEGSRTRFSSSDNIGFSHLRAQDLEQLTPIVLTAERRSGPPFDLVISVATLHWVPGKDHPRLYAAIFDLLKPGGQLRADFGGSGQIADIRDVLDRESAALGGAISPWYFPGADEVEARLVESGFFVGGGFVRLVTQRRRVPDEAAFIGWLDSQVLIAYQPSLDEASYTSFRDRSIKALLDRGPRLDGTFDQDYVRVDLLVTKPTA